MKAVTEFPAFTLTKAIQTKAAMVAEGKTPEEIQANFAESFKFEGEKLSCFIHSLEVASSNAQNLKRILVVKLNEGETAPAKAVKVEDYHFIPEFLVQANAPKTDQGSKGGRGRQGGRGGKGGGGPKGSPWGLSPEEKAAKNKKPATK